MNQQTIQDERGGVPGCSELARIMACPGSVRAIETWPKPETPAGNVAAATGGQVMHEALEVMEYIIDGQTYEMDLTAAQEWVVDKCAMLVQKVAAEVFSGNPTETFTEKRMWMLGLDGKPVLSGKADRIDRGIPINRNDRVSQGIWLISDYKTGPKPVTLATMNWQIHGNALCLENAGTLFKDFYVGQIYGVIIQPLVSLVPTIVKIQHSVLQNLRRQVREQLDRVKMDGQPRIPGDHCAYCPVSAICFEAQAVGVIATRRSTALGHLSPQQLMELHKLLPQITAKVEEVRTYLKAQLAVRPQDFPELKLVEVGNGHTCKDKIALLSALMPVISKEEYRDLLQVPIGKVRDLWVQRVAEGGGITKTDALKQWNDRILPLLTPRPPKRMIETVVPEVTNG